MASAASIEPTVAVAAEAPSTAPIARIQVVPAEFALSAGQSQKFTTKATRGCRKRG